ncbi:TenA family protein [Halohasta salina]|uniref:TenA family protein n=1 Tax=Halohasta salina TaxID=2961621 RepID=UPI0020A24259|nr:TenA family protein [Halohasta salina]
MSSDPAAAAPDSYDAYAAATDDPRFTDWLRERSEPAWTEATTHRFTRGLGAGTLDDAVVRRYLTQDYAFVDTLVGAFGHAVGEAPSMAAKRRLIEFLDVVTDDENDYFERAFEALDVPEPDRTDPDLTATTEAMVDLIEAATNRGGYAETLAVLVPAEWVYLTWATAEADDRPDAFYLAEWIDLHANPGFIAFVGWLREQLDAVGPTLPADQQARVARHFERTVRLEADFFEAAYDT